MMPHSHTGNGSTPKKKPMTSTNGSGVTATRMPVRRRVPSVVPSFVEGPSCVPVAKSVSIISAYSDASVSAKYTTSSLVPDQPKSATPTIGINARTMTFAA